MKIVCLLCMMTFGLMSSASAVAVLNQNTIKQAQFYGTSQAKIELAHFLKPWLSYEEKAEQLNENAEIAYLYTPFLLIAMDSREKKLHDVPILLEDTEKIITNYLDTLSFSVKLYGNTETFSADTVAMLKQNGKLIKAWSVAVPNKAEAAYKNSKYKYMVQGYFYFDQKELDLKSPVSLVIMTGDKQRHCFYFELAKIK